MTEDDRNDIARKLRAQLPKGCEVVNKNYRGAYSGIFGKAVVFWLLQVQTAGIGNPKAGIRTTGVRHVGVQERSAHWTDTKAVFTGPHKGRGWRDRLVADVVAAVVEDARQLAATQ